MKILVLGNNGQLGGDLCDVLTETGADFQALGRSELDIEDSDELRSVLTSTKYDALINCTSCHSTDKVELDAREAFSVNANAVRIMAQCSSIAQAQFLHISTDYVHGTYDRVGIPILEDEPTSPINVYGASKALGERLAMMENKNTAVFRVASLFGIRGASGKGGNFIETMIKLSCSNAKIKVVGDQEMSPTSTRMVAENLASFVQKKCKPGVYNLVNSGSCSWAELASYVLIKIGSNCVIEECVSSEYPTVAARPRYSVLDNRKIKELVGPIPAWDEAVDLYLTAKGHI